MERQSTISGTDQASSSVIRATSEGKTIKYDLEILRQPSAKCKLLDPSPLVQLRILELNPNGAEENITHIVYANCFLVVTLEPTNRLVQAHIVPNFKRESVLVGHTCAGMILQDDSALVGHFIFPDLSVRFEGHFRLNFSLYERVKSARDGHTRDEACIASSPGDEHFAYRLEVKSKVL